MLLLVLASCSCVLNLQPAQVQDCSRMSAAWINNELYPPSSDVVPYPVNRVASYSYMYVLNKLPSMSMFASLTAVPWRQDIGSSELIHRVTLFAFLMIRQASVCRITAQWVPTIWLL